jgi:ectoine hydroxylase-related dioxygenase (phytanoyl-CoA dioxygenase family)
VFDKNPSVNWKVPWHQDLTIAVRERRDAEHYGPWSVKEGHHHVQPALRVLEGMVAIRVYLDPCPSSAGPVRMIPGSHRMGRLSSAQISEARAVKEEYPCLVERGGLLVMRPLLLHASSRAAVPQRRRVVHLEFANTGLDSGLEWDEQWWCAA